MSLGASAVQGLGYWITTEEPAEKTVVTDQRVSETLVRLNCDEPPETLDPTGSRFVDAGVGLILDPGAGGIQGIDECGRLHMPMFPVADLRRQKPRMLSGADNTRDIVIAISPEVLTTKALRSALHTELARLTSDWVTRNVPVADMVRPIVPKGHLVGLMAAVDLEIITEAEFRGNTSKILTSIAGRTSGGRNLPSEWIRTDRTRSGNMNFDGCDVGRLLGSLWNLSRHRFGDEKTADLVKSWDLDKVIVDKRIHSVKDAALVSTYVSHCAHYSALAFRAWGYDVESPCEALGVVPDCDDKMKLLGSAAQIGPLGAEPLLLEAMDFGMSRDSAYLADMLYGAQLREYEKTGKLVCVSEGPIDRSPWFTYQDLQFDVPDRTWAIDTVRNDLNSTTAQFQSEYQAFSPKAAFLWSAHVPHAFSGTLLDHVRANGKTTIGFASSIYSKTGKPTRNHSDINTNGNILQAIAYMLRAGNRDA